MYTCEGYTKNTLSVWTSSNSSFSCLQLLLLSNKISHLNYVWHKIPCYCLHFHILAVINVFLFVIFTHATCLESRIQLHSATGHSNLLDLIYEGVSKSFRTGRLEQGLHMEKLSATRCSYVAILWVSLVSFAAITLCVASQRVFIFVSVYFVSDSVRKFLDTPS
jgi:hypothetical protein